MGIKSYALLGLWKVELWRWSGNRRLEIIYNTSEHVFSCIQVLHFIMSFQIPSKLKEALKTAKDSLERRLQDEQKMVSYTKLQQKYTNYYCLSNYLLSLMRKVMMKVMIVVTLLVGKMSEANDEVHNECIVSASSVQACEQSPVSPRIRTGEEEEKDTGQKGTAT